MFVPAELFMTPAAEQLHNRGEFLDPGQSAPLDLTVMVSCYNEKDYIVSTLDSLISALSEVAISKYEIIVVDDTSSDGSPELVKQYILAHPEQRILLRQNKTNRGLAQNYFDAAFLGKGKYYRLLCGDDAEPRDTMVTVFREIGKADILIPYYITSEGKSLYRRMLSNAFSELVNLISGHRLHYYNGLAVHLRYNIMRWHPNTRGFGFQADIMCMLLDQGFTYKEIPVRTVERKGAANSRALTFKNQLSVAHTLIDLLFRRVSHWIYKRPPAGTIDNT
jgi:glycosyltransferase involved in cell wall biosynthesis